MCCFDIIESVERCFKAVIACVCFLIIGGPVLITVGVILLNKNGNDIDEFKKAVQNFDPTPIKSWTGTLNAVRVAEQRVNLNVKGVSGAESVFVEATVPVPSSVTSTLPVDVRVNTVNQFTRNAVFVKTNTKTYICSSSHCRSSILGCNCDRALARFRDKCISEGGAYHSSTSKCTKGTHCGRCETTLYLNRLYLVVKEASKGVYVEDTRFKSAKYDFTDFANDYTSSKPSSVDVRLYSDKDPFIALQRLTMGTGSFSGLRIGYIVMIVIGVVMTLLEICVCVALICYCMRKRRDSAPVSETPPPVQQGYAYSQPPPPVQQGYAYSQPPPPVQHGYAYSQPPPPVQQGYAYGQPLGHTQEQYSYGQPKPFFS